MKTGLRQQGWRSHIRLWFCCNLRKHAQNLLVKPILSDQAKAWDRAEPSEAYPESLRSWLTAASNRVTEWISTTKDTKNTNAASPQRQAIALLIFFVIFVVHKAFFYDASKRCL